MEYRIWDDGMQRTKQYIECFIGDGFL
jgi:hypothetical protein